uniref:DDHD domain-containing protein n=2 Tax=Caenorhabditis japonica TaxID=281687 RepID=A0A8R1DZ92_CAEJA
MDVMYYQSPLFRTEIVRGVVAQLNRTYKLFKANNPKFSGHVHIFGHSLGSVICYDVLTQYSPLMLYDKYVTKSIDEYLKREDVNNPAEAMKAMEAMKLAREQVRDNMEGGIQKILVTKEEQLDFKVKYLFAVGSPLGVFLTMRGGDSSDLLSSATNCERVFNIFHPYDPVAYRLEPFFAPEYKHIRPIKLFSSSDLRGRASYDSLPLDVYKHYLKKLKNQNKNKKNKDDKTADARSGGDDEIDEEDECDSDEDARSGCSSPRSMTPPPYENPAAAAATKETKALKKGWFSFGSSNNNPKKVQSSASLNSGVAATSTESVEVGKEAEAELPLAERILGAAVRVPHRIDFQLQSSSS